MMPFELEVMNQIHQGFSTRSVTEDLRGELRRKEWRIEELSIEAEKWKQRYIGLLISGLEAHEIEDYVDELENVE